MGLQKMQYNCILIKVLLDFFKKSLGIGAKPQGLKTGGERNGKEEVYIFGRKKQGRIGASRYTGKL